MPPELTALLAAQGGVATSAQLLLHLSRRGLQRLLRTGELTKIYPGIYCCGAPDVATRLRGLDLRCGEPVAACSATAAAVHGFDTEDVARWRRSTPPCAVKPALRAA